MIVPVEMFARWYCIGIFDIFPVVIEPNVEWCFWFTKILNVTNRALELINNEDAFTVNSMVDFQRFVGLDYF